MQLIKSPWRDLFYELSASCRHSIKITSPYIKDNVVAHLVEKKKPKVELSILTSFKLMNYYSGASDLNALERVINSNGIVRNVQKLHAKIYIFDDSKAIVTSGNLTNGGLTHNFEYGVYFDDADTLKIIDADFDALSNNSSTGKIMLDNIQIAREILSRVPKSKPIVLPEIVSPSDDVEIFTGGSDSISSSLTGWKLEVFNCLLQLPHDNFTTSDVNKFGPSLSKKFPGNNNIEAKIRQQLQYLRDIGLVEFVARGQYRKLWL